MRNSMKMILGAAFVSVTVLTAACSGADDSAVMASRVKADFQHAWSAYTQYAWGHEMLRPLTKAGRDWYGTSLNITPIDVLDSLVLLGEKDEADRTRRFIVEHTSFDQDIFVKNFEITIRLLGGLLSSYQLTGDKQLLALADDLGRRLLPVFDSPTGMPYTYVNLKTGKTRDANTNPAEIGTLLLEFGTLGKLTGKAIYFDKAKRAVVELFKRRPRPGQTPAGIGAPHVGAGRHRTRDV